MDAHCIRILKQVKSTPDFSELSLEDIDETNASGRNALHCVASWGDVEAAKALIDNDIEIDVQGEHRYTPLHEAIQLQRLEMVEYLISAGADPAIANDFGTTDELIDSIEDPSMRKMLRSAIGKP